MSVSKTRERLIEVARGLFAHQGLEATTMNDIAAASGKGRRTLYTYFRNKEEIYLAVIEEELARLSTHMTAVLDLDLSPEEKLFKLIYTHLRTVRDTVFRNGTLRAEFFRDIWMVEKVRRAFDAEEHRVLTAILEEGVAQGRFRIPHVGLMCDIIHCAVRGLEVPYIYDRLGQGLSEDETYPMVKGILCRVLDMPDAVDVAGGAAIQ